MLSDFEKGLLKVKQVVWAIVALKGLGGLLFVIGNIFGAYLLVRTSSSSFFLFTNIYKILVIVLSIDFWISILCFLGFLLGGCHSHSI